MVMYEGVNSADNREELEKKVPLFVCTEIRNIPLPYIAGFTPIGTYNSLFKTEAVETGQPKIPKFLYDKVQFIEFNGIIN